MYSRIFRFATGASATQVGKKLALTTTAGALIYTYAQECKNDVLYFNKTK